MFIQRSTNHVRNVLSTSTVDVKGLVLSYFMDVYSYNLGLHRKFNEEVGVE